MPNQFPPELVEKGRALWSAAPLVGQDDPSLTKKERQELISKWKWARDMEFANVMRDAIGDAPENARTKLISAFGLEIGRSDNSIRHFYYTGAAWPDERRDPAQSFWKHYRHNDHAREACTEEDWADIWNKPLKRDLKRAQKQDHADEDQGSGTDAGVDIGLLLEQLRDPVVYQTLQMLVAGESELSKQAKRVFGLADKARRESQKHNGTRPLDYYNYAIARLTKLSLEAVLIEQEARFMVPDMRARLLKTGDQVVTSLTATLGAVKNIDRIAALKAQAAGTSYEPERKTAIDHAERLATERLSAQYGVSVNLNPSNQDAGERGPTGLPTSAGNKGGAGVALRACN